MMSRLLRLGNRGSISQNFIITKRWSGHNAMDIRPSNISMKLTNNWIHFYVIIGAVPVAVITTIINIRANPELTEIPEGYEPRHWEYYKHPISRFLAKYMFNPNELDRECLMAVDDYYAKRDIMKEVSLKCEKVMKFYNDHRSFYFLPFFGDYVRSSRDEALFKMTYEATQPNTILELAYDPESKIVPVDGYPANFNPADYK